MKPISSSEDEAVRVAQELKILSVATRLRILLFLRSRDLCVGALARCLGLTQGAVSQHLAVLREAGLISAERRGHYVHYAVNVETLSRWTTRIGDLVSTGNETDVAGATCACASPPRGRTEGGLMCGKNQEGECKKDKQVKPGACSAEKIRECHGTGKGHPCTTGECSE